MNRITNRDINNELWEIQSWVEKKAKKKLDELFLHSLWVKSIDADRAIQGLFPYSRIHVDFKELRKATRQAAPCCRTCRRRM